MGILRDYEAFLIDLDGVVYLLHQPIPGSREFVERLREEKKPFAFLTNNSVATAEQFVERLAGMGMEVRAENVVTSSQAVGRYLDLHRDSVGPTGFVIGERGLIEELSLHDIELLKGKEGEKADTVFVGWDRAFDYEKLKTAVIAIRGGALFIATNLDSTYPTPGGLWPGAGSIVAAVATGSGREPISIGKPDPMMIDLALERMGVRRESALLIGDRLDTDIKAGISAGVDTVLVLTGISTERDIAETGIQPSRVVERLNLLLDD